MPQNAKFEKIEIIEKAVEIVEDKGIEFLTARLLGEKLNSSSRPIFTTFKNMDEVLKGVQEYANNLYQSYVNKGLKEPLAFKGVGTAYIHFAKEHPKLFQILFMKSQNEIPSKNTVLGLIEDSYEKILNSIIQNYNISEKSAKELYLNMWIYSHGIAVLITNNMCKFSDEEISKMLTTIFKSLLINEMTEVKHD